MPSTIIQARVDAAAKKQAQVICSKLGITLSDGVRMFVNQVAVNKGLPFRPTLLSDSFEPNAKTSKAIKDAKAGKGIKKYATPQDMYDDLGI